MIKILFICHGNICRSPTAEFVMKDLVAKKGVESKFLIESAATSSEEIGCDMYWPAKSKLKEKGIPFTRRKARQVRSDEYDRWDYIFGMDDANVRNLKHLFHGDPENKVHYLLDNRSVSDPWYTGNFERAFNDIKTGCEIWLERLL